MSHPSITRLSSPPPLLSPRGDTGQRMQTADYDMKFVGRPASRSPRRASNNRKTNNPKTIFACTIGSVADRCHSSLGLAGVELFDASCMYHV